MLQHLAEAGCVLGHPHPVPPPLQAHLVSSRSNTKTLEHNINTEYFSLRKVTTATDLFPNPRMANVQIIWGRLLLRPGPGDIKKGVTKTQEACF